MYRGHEGVRELFRDLYESFSEFHAEYSEIRDLGERLVASGRLRIRGKGSGVETESPVGVLADSKEGKLIRMLTYLDPDEALQGAGLRE